MQKPQLAIAFAGLLVAAPVHAQNEPMLVEGGLPVAVVSYADLNISSPAGRHVLEGRVTRAASDLCLENYRQSPRSTIASRSRWPRHESTSTSPLLARAASLPRLARSRSR